MDNKKLSLPKTLSWSYAIVAAFAAAYLVGGIILDRQANKHKR